MDRLGDQRLQRLRAVLGDDDAGMPISSSASTISIRLTEVSSTTITPDFLRDRHRSVLSLRGQLQDSGADIVERQLALDRADSNATFGMP